MTSETTATDDALPQLLGDFSPIDVWQIQMNLVFYGLRGAKLRELYQTFAAADYRLGFALAADYLKQVQRRETADPSTTSNTLTIMEWGCGNGNLAACFLDRVQTLDSDESVYPRIQYILIDSSDVVLESAKSNDDLAKHQNRIRFEQAQVPELQSFAAHSVDRIICNEFWNETSTKLLLRKAGDIMEEHVRPNLKETRLQDFPDWPVFMQAFEQVDVSILKKMPNFLEDIVVPTTILCAMDDPFVDPTIFKSVRMSNSIELNTPENGGHMGYFSRKPTPWGDYRWMDFMVVDWMNS